MSCCGCQSCFLATATWTQCWTHTVFGDQCKHCKLRNSLSHSEFCFESPPSHKTLLGFCAASVGLGLKKCEHLWDNDKVPLWLYSTPAFMEEQIVIYIKTWATKGTNVGIQIKWRWVVGWWSDCCWWTVCSLFLCPAVTLLITLLPLAFLWMQFKNLYVTVRKISQGGKGLKAETSRPVKSFN